MPLVAFRPTKARLVLEQSRENVLMLKILVATGETVSLASGGTLESLAGLMRIRERKDERGRGNDEALGSITYVDATVEGQRRKAANFHVDIALSSTQFDALLKVAVSGRLPAKLFAQIGERVSARETKGLVYLIQGATKVKFWNNRRNPTLPVTNFSVILPIDVPELAEQSESMEPGEAMERMEPIEPIDTDLFDEEHSPAESLTGTLKIAELADEFTVFRAETKNTLTAIVSVVAVIGILLLVINLVLILR